MSPSAWASAPRRGSASSAGHHHPVARHRRADHRAAAPRQPAPCWPYLGLGVGQGPSGEVLPRGLPECPPCEVERLGRVVGVDLATMTTGYSRGRGGSRCHVQGDRGTFLPGELAAELAAGGSPRTPAAGAGHAEPHQVAHVSQAVISLTVTLPAPMPGHLSAPLTKAGSGSSERCSATRPGPGRPGMPIRLCHHTSMPSRPAPGMS